MSNIEIKIVISMIIIQVDVWSTCEFRYIRNEYTRGGFIFGKSVSQYLEKLRCLIKS